MSFLFLGCVVTYDVNSFVSNETKLFNESTSLGSVLDRMHEVIIWLFAFRCQARLRLGPRERICGDSAVY